MRWTKRASRTAQGMAVVGVLALLLSGLALVAPGATAAAPYAVTLAASSTSLAVGGTVTLTATANQDVGPTPYGLSIVNSTTGVVLKHVGTGTTTSVTVTETSATSQSFVGRIDTQGGSPIAATSSPVTVTWGSQSQAPAFSADAATSSATVGSSYSYTYAATGSPAPTFSVTSGTIPPGLTLTASTGVLSGIPTTAATYTFVVGASNSAGTAAGQSQTIVVATGGVSGYAVTLAASSTSLAVGGTVTLTATANQDVGPTPYGLSIVNSTTGVVLKHVGTGTTTSVTVTETSATSQSFVGRIDTQGGSPIAATSSPVTVTWGSQSQAPAFSADAATSSATVGSSYSYTYAATGSPAPTFSVTSGTIPPGLTLTASTGVLSGIPTTAATYTFVVGASNSAGTAAGQSQTIVVANSTPAPVVTGLNPTTGTPAGGTSVTITGTSFTGATAVHFGATPATGVTLNSPTSITATSPAGTGTVDVTVTTPAGTSATSSADHFIYYVPANQPTLIQTAAGQGGNGTQGSTVAIPVTLGTPCAAGDTLIAMVTIGQQSSAGGEVSAVPSGWQRLFEHSPTDDSPYQGWYALSNCTGTSSVTFSITSPGNTSGTSGSVVVGEYAGLSNPIATDFDVNDGSSTAESAWTLPGEPPAASGELVLTALSFYASSGTSTTPTGWASAGSESSSMPAFVYDRLSSSSAPSATFGWSASSPFEVTMLALKSGTTVENVVQEAQQSYSAQSTWPVALPQGIRSTDSLIAIVGTDQPGVSVTGLSGGGVTWQKVVGSSQAGNGTSEIWAGFGSGGTSGSTTITATLSGNADGHILVSEVSGISGIDTSASAPGSGGSAAGSSLGAQANDFQVASVTTNGTSIVVHPQPQWSTYSLSASSYADEWIPNAGAPPVPTWSLAASAPWVVVQAAFTSGVPTPPAAPTVASLSPTTGTSAGGTSVTITGTGFTGATAVHFGTTAATGVTVNSATSITATSPAGTGTVDVTVTTPAGTSATSSADQFTYSVAAPTVTGLSPTTGTSAGGTSVTITGTGFTGATAVHFGTTAATGVTVNSATSITATSPAGTGTVDVTVTTPAGTSTTSAADQFTYTIAAPAVSSVSPNAGSTTGGTSVTITGTGFTGATAVHFGATAATGVTVNSPTSITATSPAGTGTVDVTVTTPVGTSTTSAADHFTYTTAAPTVTGLSPTTGTSAGGTSVTITGTGFTGATAVHFGATAATGVTVNSATSITATSPAGTGTVDVTVTTPAGTSATSSADQFTYSVAAPVVTGLNPTTGPSVGGTSVTITGTGFSGATAVHFGATAATGVTVNSATSITATSPAGTGTVDVTVTTPAGTSTTGAADQFTYTIAAPTVTSVSPNTGFTTGGTSVTITGTGFSGATAVHFGATPATGVTVNSPTSITATSPAGTGTVDVTVTTPAGTSTTSAADQFTYTTAAPTVTSVSPNTGFTTGGTSVTITGTGFTGATAVHFGATAATGVTVNSPTSITATSPAGTGTVDVTVTTPAGASATSSADHFTYTTAAPTVTGLSPTTGTSAGGTSVTITGTGFSGATAVHFGATAATGVTVNSATSITATSPAGTGTVDVTVTTPAGTSATTANDRFTYATAAATISEAATFPVSPAETKGAHTITINPQHIGDLVIIAIQVHSTTAAIASVSGGNVATWKQAAIFHDTANDLTYDVFYGVATATGAATATLTYTQNLSTMEVELVADSYTASAGTNWTVVTSGGATSNGAQSTSVLFPTLTSGTQATQLYWGASEEHTTGGIGSTPGFTYHPTPDGNVFLDNPKLAPSSNYAPVAPESPADLWTAIGVIFAVS